MKYQITILNYVPSKSFHLQCISFGDNVPTSTLTFHTFKEYDLFNKLFDYLEATVGEADVCDSSDWCITLDEDLIWYESHIMTIPN
jgi:hypothetical protein